MEYNRCFTPHVIKVFASRGHHGPTAMTSDPVLLYLVLIVTQLLFRKRPDSEVNAHGLLLNSTWTRILQTKHQKTNKQKRIHLCYSFLIN